MMSRLVLWLAAAACLSAATVESPLDRFIREATQTPRSAPYSSGSLYTAGSILGDLPGDFRGVNVNDLITIVVSDRATALAKGTATSKRTSSASASIPALAGPTRGRILPNLAQLQGNQQLEGQGQTSRDMVLTTTITGRITHVLPNGNFIVEGAKDIVVNSERQSVTIRGVGRWTDLSAANQVASDRLGYLEIKVQGKGVVNDAVRRPNLLYRILLGLLPF
jgi:flagellar L-ring protein precursor FlgH